MIDVLLKEVVDYEVQAREAIFNWAEEHRAGQRSVSTNSVLSRILATDVCSESVIYLRVLLHDKTVVILRVSAMLNNESPMSSYGMVEMVIPKQGWVEVVTVPGGFLDFEAMPPRNDVNEKAEYLISLSLKALDIAHHTLFEPY